MNELKSLPRLSDRLKYIREKKGLSQIDLAEMCGTTQQAIQQAEAGKAKQPRYLHRLALALDVPFEWLVMNETPKASKKNAATGFSDHGRDVLASFFAMPKKDQALILQLMKSREKNSR